MQLYNQIALRENEELYNYLKSNSAYFKLFNRDLIDSKTFLKEMKIKYKKRNSDKITKALDNMEMVSSILDILK